MCLRWGTNSVFSEVEMSAATSACDHDAASQETEILNWALQKLATGICEAY
jgi:hypothetical protein